MNGSLLSSSWYRVVDLKPRLRPHARMHRHRYRGQVWFVMSDAVSGRTQRFTPPTRLILNGMDGQRTVGELWDVANRRLGDAAPTQDELINLLGQLHAADLMQCDVSPDVSELLFRAQRHERTKSRQTTGNPMSIKIPLVDPDKLLNRIQPFMQPLWNRWGALAWLAVVLPAVVLGFKHAGELGSNVSDHVLATHNLLMLAVLFPLIKGLHEMGHAVAAKMRGAEVHEMGVMLLMLMPVPYVDASAASTFKSKTDRALVGAAGMLVEIFLAALAMYLWVAAEPGFLRSAAYNTIFVAGLSTLVFNGNPLLRYDGYYILSDLIEIPNLAVQSNRYVGYLLERYVFRAQEAQAPQASRSEKAWFAFYAPAAFFYRTLVSISIILFIAGEFFVIGVMLAIWAFVSSFLLPLWRVFKHLVSSPVLSRVRSRAYGITAGVAISTTAFLLWIPMPFRTQTEGVVWLPERAIVRAGTDGFLSHWLVKPGSEVRQGEALVESIDPALQVQIRVSEAKVAELEARFNALFVDDKVGAEVAREELLHEQAALTRLQERASDLVVHSPGNGHFMVPQPSDMAGRFYRKGALLGYITEQARPQVKVVLSQGEFDVVRLSTRRVELRHAYNLNEVLAGQIVQQTPGGAVQLPSRALTTEGGGQIAVDPRDNEGLTALSHTFQVDIDSVPNGLSLYGGRVHVRFEHEPEPLGVQWYRRLRPVFLSHFHV